MPIKTIKKLLRKLKPKKQTPELPISVINEFVEEFENETKNIEIFLSVYKKHKMRKKIEKRMKLFEGHHNKWKDVQKVANSAVLLSKTIKKQWTIKKQKAWINKIRKRKQIYNALFNITSNKNKSALRLMREKEEKACEAGVNLQREYLYSITDKRIKKTFEEALVDSYTIWKKFTSALEEEKYKIVE